MDISPFYQVNLACGYLEIHARGLLRSFGMPRHILLIEIAKKLFWEKLFFYLQKQFLKINALNYGVIKGQDKI